MDRTTDFASIWAAVAGVEGWLTEAQARRLHDAARRLSAGQKIVEIGSYRGRSAIVLALSAPEGVEVVAIDPHAGNDRGPREIHGTADEGQGDNDVFWANLRAAGVADRVRHVRKMSTDAHGDVDGEIELLYIDGAHRYAPALDDILTWGARVPPGGTMLIHDSFNSVGVTAAQLRSLVFSGRFRYVGRSTSMSEYRREDLGGADRAKNAGKQLAQLGYFAQSVAIKVALVAKQPKVAAALGHRGDAPWPY
ncbi:MAG TPA: class I SAM-dependent methyltransferase [Acidimicrobiales bacterium]|nr:class I SAM-dependent methyltransferase [Acidimicrobiales bacterium]